MKSLAWIAVALACSACTLKVPGSNVNVRIDLPRGDHSIALAPAFSRPGLALFSPIVPDAVTDMDCFFLNVNGPGISDDSTASGRELTFLNLGVTSTMADRTDGFVSMRVPAGLTRTIQVLGIAAVPSLLGQCQGKVPSDFLLTNRPALFEVARTTLSLYQDSTVTIPNSYDFFTAYDLMSQYSGSLLLNQGYTGSSTQGTINFLTGGLPPAGMTDITVGSLESAFLSLRNPATVDAALRLAVAPPGAGNLFARLDFAFALGSIDISKYSTFRVDGLVGGGTSAYMAGACQSTLASNGGVDMAAYSPTDLQAWSTPAISTTTTTSAISLELPLTAEFIDTYQGQRFIHLALLSEDAANGAFCSNIVVDQLKITLLE